MGRELLVRPISPSQGWDPAPTCAVFANFGAGGGVFFYCPKAGTSPLNKGLAAVLAISCYAPPGSAAGRSLEYTTRGEKRLIMRNMIFSSLSCFCYLLAKARVDYESMKSWHMFLDRPSERSKTSPGLILRSAPLAELAIPRFFFAGAAAVILFFRFGNIKEAVKLNTRDRESKESNEADERRARFVK